MGPVITIAGGGFAGTALAVQLARQPALAQARIHLVEPRPVPGPGLAYGTRQPEHLLNVPAGALGLYDGQPTHFADWLARQPDAADGLPRFARREAYGRYLAEEVAAVLADPADAAAPGVRWHRSRALTAARMANGQRHVQLADGTVIGSDYVVLALGNFPPPPPAGPDLAYLTHPGYHADPWQPGALARIGPDDAVLLIGSGLTAIDVLLTLQRQGHRASVQVVAHHGRWPAAHGPAAPPYSSFYAELAAKATVLEVLQVVRRHLRQAPDWRAVLDSLRPDLPRIWAAWPLAEQRLFLRRVAGLWAVCRHRSPPQNAAAVVALTAAGQVQLRTGRATEIVPDGELLRVRVCPAQGPDTWYTVRHAVCCAGPLLDYGRIAEPLVRALRTAGELCPDALRLGIMTDEHGALLNAEGQASASLFTLGASRRPAYFESTAVPELRQQAAALAAELGRRAGK